MNALTSIITAPTDARSSLEASERYSKVVVSLSDRHRVVECRGGIQWIVQRRMKRMDDRAWEGQAYCATSKALMRVIHGLEPRLEASVRETLEALPERIGR